jgi:2-polyprenyl-3-methyl-5-hydroxy-6-metoxy-1,4-benzoquinol methylase
MTIVRRVLHKIAVNVLNWIPNDLLQNVLIKVAKVRAFSLSPTEGLRFLLELDSALYPFQGQLSVAYDGGLHTKHRHMRYHDFFVDRVCAEERVLDIGCGVGTLAFDVAEKANAHVVGIDMNESNIALAQQRFSHPSVQYLVGDALKDLPDETYDVVILSNVLEHIADRTRFLTTVLEAVKPSLVLIRVPMFERDWRVPLKKEIGVEWRLDPTHKTEYTIESFAEEMENSGLNIFYQEVRWGEIWAELRPDNLQI